MQCRRRQNLYDMAVTLTKKIKNMWCQSAIQHNDNAEGDGVQQRLYGINSLYYYSSTGSHYHQHAGTTTDSFKIQVYCHYCVSSNLHRFFFQFLQCIRPCFFYYSLIGSTAAAYNIAYACKNIFYNIGTDNGFRRYYSEVLPNRFSFNSVCSCK